MSNNGKWKLSSKGQALVISSGLIYLGDKKPKGLNLEEVLEMIKKAPYKSYYSKGISRPIKLGETLAHDEFRELGSRKVMYSSIDLVLLNPDRVFKELPRTGHQLLNKHYQSKPIQRREHATDRIQRQNGRC